MIKHVVLFKFKPGASEAKFTELETRMKELPKQIPEIRSYELGLDVVRSERSYDFALVSAFEELGSLKSYQAHPAHQEVLAMILELFEEIIAVDFPYQP